MFLDVLRLWEADPSDCALWMLLVMFFPKPLPAGGVRPIILNCIWLRLWSRLRQPLVAEWERRLEGNFYWGGADKTCDRAGHVHDLLAAFCTQRAGQGMAAGTAAVDLSKYYE